MGCDKTEFCCIFRNMYSVLTWCIKQSLKLFNCHFLTTDQLSHTAPASERVKFILGGDGGEEEKPVLETPQLFTELEELFVCLDGNAEWKETARWYVSTLFIYLIWEDTVLFLLNVTVDIAKRYIVIISKVSYKAHTWFERNDIFLIRNFHASLYLALFLLISIVAAWEDNGLASMVFTLVSKVAIMQY